jgi:hypothetical protein
MGVRSDADSRRGALSTGRMGGREPIFREPLFRNPKFELLSSLPPFLLLITLPSSIDNSPILHTTPILP